MKRPVILLDADVLRYQLAYSNSKSIDWDGDGEKVEVAVNPARALDACREYIDEMVEKFGASDYVLALSCKRHNFRKDILPTYKDNRTAKPKPSLWYVLDEFLYSAFAEKIVERPSLEGDDILGLLATHPSPKRAPGPRIVVSIDKDLQTIPCRLYNPNKPDIGVRTITLAEADLFWMKQTLTGDTIDNYTGIPGVGHKFADELLMPIHEAYRDGPPEDHFRALWDVVLKTYLTKKPRGGGEALGVAGALVQARCARILRDGDYNHKTKEIRLWRP